MKVSLVQWYAVASGAWLIAGSMKRRGTGRWCRSRGPSSGRSSLTST